MFALNEMAVLECAYVYVNLPLKTAPPTYPLTFNFLTLTAYLNQLWTQPIVTLQLQLQLYCTTIFWMYVYVSKFEFSSMHTIIKIQIFIFFSFVTWPVWRYGSCHLQEISLWLSILTSAFHI